MIYIFYRVFDNCPIYGGKLSFWCKIIKIELSDNLLSIANKGLAEHRS